MAIISWSDNLSVGIRAFDQHHQHLVELINNLHDAMATGKGSGILGKILTELADYTVYHFKAEEALFHKHGYPGYDEHKKNHDDLTNQVLDFKAKFEAGEMVISIEIMKFLTDWLTNHILGADKAYVPFLKSKGID